MLHREGKATILISIVVLFALNALIKWVAPEIFWLQDLILFGSVVLLLIVLQFFRNPAISVVQNESHVLAPADGKVVVIEEVVETEFFNEKRIQVSVFMSPFNVHVNRNPIGGIVKFFKYHPGKYLVAWHPKSSTENERTTIVIEKSTGLQILFRQIAGALARRIVWYVKENQAVKQGNEMGFIKFGSRVDVFLPLNSKVMVELNQKVKGGKTVLAELK